MELQVDDQNPYIPRSPAGPMGSDVADHLWARPGRGMGARRSIGRRGLTGSSPLGGVRGKRSF